MSYGENLNAMVRLGAAYGQDPAALTAFEAAGVRTPVLAEDGDVYWIDPDSGDYYIVDDEDYFDE